MSLYPTGDNLDQLVESHAPPTVQQIASLQLFYNNMIHFQKWLALVPPDD